MLARIQVDCRLPIAECQFGVRTCVMKLAIGNWQSAIKIKPEFTPKTMVLTKYAPETLKRSGLYKELSRKRRRWNLRKQLSVANPVRVVLGAGQTSFPGWFHTDRELLDVTSPADWSALFEPDSIDLLLSEHMLEHLTEDE